MRHTKKHNKIGRTASHRDAMMANMASSLIEHKRISTTLAKARMLRRFVEPLITKSKTDTTHSRRTVFSALQNKYAVTELFREIAPKVSDRPGGYTRILKTGFRKGDGAEMCFIELVDYNETYTQHKERERKKTRRSRRGSGSGTAKSGAADTAKREVKAEESPDADSKPENSQLPDSETPEEVAEESSTEIPAGGSPVEAASKAEPADAEEEPASAKENAEPDMEKDEQEAGSEATEQEEAEDSEDEKDK